MLYIWLLNIAAQEKVMNNEQIALIGYVIIVTFLLVFMFVIFFTTFQKRKNKLLLDKIDQQRKFEEEIAKTQLEIQDQTLKNVGQELHDNVGQLLSFASMQLNLVSSLTSDKIKEKVDDTKNVIKDTIQEVRALSKSLNSDVILNLGLKKSIQNEVDRLNKLKTIHAELRIEGEERELDNKKDEIILFRIIQEFFSNTNKYSEAEHLSVILNYTNETLVITAKDDGKGFDKNTIEQGSGLINMNSRAALINTKLVLQSQPGQGVELTLNYPLG